jgi:hypothetical protein
MARMMMSRFLPEPFRKLLRAIRFFIFYTGDDRLCPVCGKTSRRFGSRLKHPREDALCMWCGSHERHRFAWVFLSRCTDLFDDQFRTMLHLAPERCLQRRFEATVGLEYITADLHDPAAMVRIDITDIEYDDDTFDVVYCSHVLEHVGSGRRTTFGATAPILPTGSARQDSPSRSRLRPIFSPRIRCGTWASNPPVAPSTTARNDRQTPFLNSVRCRVAPGGWW